MAGGVRVSLAFNDATLEPSPTWVDITQSDTGAAFASSFTIDRGRQFELDLTDVGRAVVQINDRHGVLDPTNPSSPYSGLIEPLLQAQLELWDPVAAAWSTLFRGYVAEMDYVFNPSAYDFGGVRVGVNQLTLSLVDALFLLAQIEMQADGSFGDVVPLGAEGQVFFDNANVDDRMFQVLGNAAWPSALATIFSGNVALRESIYSPGGSVLDVLRQAADAEFPGLGNVYGSRIGKVTFHGRKAKFNPVAVAAGAGAAWPFTHWKCGDGKAVHASISDTAQIREFSFNRGISRIINYAVATPEGILDQDVAGQIVLDGTSIGLRGFWTWSKEGLIVDTGTTTGNNANDECKLFAQYYVDNYADPRNRITNLAFRSMRPDDPRAEANWAFLAGAEIADLLDVTIDSPGGGGFAADAHFIEGLHYEVRPLAPDYADVTMRPDLSPQAYYTPEYYTDHFE